MLQPTSSLEPIVALQATWAPERQVLLWSASGGLDDALAEIPGLDRSAGTEASRELAVLGPRVGRRDVPTLALDLGAALRALASLPADADVSDSVRCFSLLAKLALELAARQRAIPTVIRGEARWRALLSRTADRDRVQAIVEALPPAARCVPVSGKLLRLRPSEDVVRSFLDAAIDHLYRQRAYPGPSRGWVRAWADGLRDEDASFSTRDARWAAMPGRIGQWAAGAEDPSPRVGFALELPQKKTGRFPLRLLLHAPGDPDNHVPMASGWGAGSSL